MMDSEAMTDLLQIALEPGALELERVDRNQLLLTDVDSHIFRITVDEDDSNT